VLGQSFLLWEDLVSSGEKNKRWLNGDFFSISGKACKFVI